MVTNGISCHYKCVGDSHRLRAERDEQLPFRVDVSKADLKRTVVDCSALSINAPLGIRDAPPGQGVPLGPMRSPLPPSFSVARWREPPKQLIAGETGLLFPPVFLGLSLSFCL